MRTLPILSALLAVGLLGGCRTGGPDAAPREPADLRWPAPPEAARIAYVRSLSRPADTGAARSGAGRFLAWLTGAGDEALIKPFGVAVDENDNLCLTDTGAGAVLYLDHAGQKWRRWDHVGPIRFKLPVAVARRRGTFYVADSGLASVLAFGEDGRLKLQITNRLERPTGLTIAGERLLVADAQRHCVVSFDLEGRYRSEFGQRGAGPGEFNIPTHVAADAEGNLYVTDSMNSRVQVFDAAGKFKSQIGGAGDAPGFFSRPKGVAADSFGHVYVIDANFDNFQIFDPGGRVLLGVGGAGSEPGRFWLPNGMAINSQNEVFVTDCYNGRVQVFKYVGQP